MHKPQRQVAAQGIILVDHFGENGTPQRGLGELEDVAAAMEHEPGASSGGGDLRT